MCTGVERGGAEDCLKFIASERIDGSVKCVANLDLLKASLSKKLS